jgi:hypothetical protein
MKIPPAAGGTLRAEAGFALSRALVASGGDRREAERLALAARDAFAAHSVTPRDDWMRGQIAAWLERLRR